MNSILMAYRLYFKFSGRATIKEYWSFFAYNFVGVRLLEFLAFDTDNYTGKTGISSPLLTGLFFIFLIGNIIPMLAVGVRRMHDTGNEGWKIIIPIYNIVQFASKGDIGPNIYGPDPNSDELEKDIVLSNEDGSDMNEDDLKKA